MAWKSGGASHAELVNNLRSKFTHYIKWIIKHFGLEIDLMGKEELLLSPKHGGNGRARLEMGGY